MGGLYKEGETARQYSSQARSAAGQRLSEHEEVLASSVMLVMAGWPYCESANA